MPSGVYKRKIKDYCWGNVRKKILLRDNYICQNCGIEATEVHHKDGSGSNKIRKEMNNSLVNLMSVCHRCNIILDLELWGVKSFSNSWKEKRARNEEIVSLSKKFPQTEVSKRFGITRQRVNQIIKKI